LRFFEMGKIYSEHGEKEAVGILLTGRRAHDWRLSRKEGVEFSDLKGTLERVFQSIGTNVVYEITQTPVFASACACIKIDGQEIGVLGKIARNVLNNWEIKNQDIYYATFLLDGILGGPEKIFQYQPISEFPAIVRDVSLAVKKEIPYKKVEEICLAQGGDILRSVHFIEQYLGDKIQSGYKGLVFSCHYQSHARTLREDEVTVVHERVLQALTRDLNAIRR